VPASPGSTRRTRFATDVDITLVDRNDYHTFQPLPY
jgi:NADH dehydrogenase FAD-containing subunit